jgi:RNA polymerase sigma factor (sigma-70 family)
MDDKPPPLSEELGKIYEAKAPQLREIGGQSKGQDAADVVHDAFAKTLEAGRRHSIRDPLHFVFKVTRNTMLSRLRYRVRHSEHTFHEEVHAEQTADTERVVMASERLHRAMQIIENMPARRREAFLLHRLEEMRYEQIAKHMGVSLKAVEKHISAALAQLHREMEA